MKGSLDLGSVLRLRAVLRAHRTEVALAALTRDLRLLGQARLPARVPAIAIVHGLPMLRENLGHELTYRWFADGILTPTRWLADVARRYGYVRNIPVAVVPDGIDDRAYPAWEDLRAGRERAREACGLPADTRIFLSAGRLIARKNFGFLLPILPALGEGSDWQWWIAGEGPERGALESSIRALGLQGRVRLLGERSDMLNLFLAADALLVPSTSEQLPLAVLEAVRSGVPRILVSGTGAAAELSELGATPLPANDAPLWAGALAECLSGLERTRIPSHWDRGVDRTAALRIEFLEGLAVRKGKGP